MAERVPALSYFFPAHNEAENIEALVAEALPSCPSWPTSSRSSPSTTARRTARAPSPTGWRPSTRRCAWSTTRSTAATVAALRSGFAASRFPLVAFTDGDRQFRIEDVGRLLAPDGGGRQARRRGGLPQKRADPFVRLAYARFYRFALRVWFGLKVKDVGLRLQALPARGARGHPPGVAGRLPVG